MPAARVPKPTWEHVAQQQPPASATAAAAAAATQALAAEVALAVTKEESAAWPLEKVEAQMAAQPAAAGRGRTAVLLSTGALNPIHRGHVEILERCAPPPMAQLRTFA